VAVLVLVVVLLAVLLLMLVDRSSSPALRLRGSTS